MNFWSELSQELVIPWAGVVAAIISSTAMYLTFTIILRVWGQRLYANRSGPGMAVVLVLGAIVGRSMLGPRPTVSTGFICLVTLLLLESFLGTGRRAGFLGYRRPVVIYHAGQFNRRALRKYHLDESVIWARLRQANISTLDDVAALILEVDGNVSVLRTGTVVDVRLFVGVRGADAILS